MVKAKRKLVVVGQTPPPYHGQAVAIQAMIDALQVELEVIHVPMQFSDTVSENGKLSLKKVWHLWAVIFKTIWQLGRNPGAVLYYPPAPASWVPLIRDLVILSCVRPFCGKVVFQYHAHGIGGFIADRKWLRWPAWSMYNANLALVMGQSSIADTKKLRPKRIAVVPYGIDVPVQTTRRVEGNGRKLRILYVGMHTESKGIFDLLATANLLRDKNVEFRTAGTFKYAEAVPRFEAMLEDLELEGIVTPLGQQVDDQLWEEYRQADIFFFPTKYDSESFGCVVVEAMAHALPVVASDWHGPKDIVTDRVSGKLCQPGDPKSFAAALSELIENEELRKEYGAAGFERYQRHYTRTAFAESVSKEMRLQVER